MAPHTKVAVVVTSISAPNQALRDLASGCSKHGWDYYVIGDVISPTDFAISGCKFFSIAEQVGTGFRTARLCPHRHYARKNVGYLLAVRSGAEVLVETDDDNLPEPGFWAERRRRQSVRVIRHSGWVNVYRYFSDLQIWPRGLPLDASRCPLPEFEFFPYEEVDCPIQQGLADEDPDVDAIYRMFFPLPLYFRRDRRLALSAGAWSPFNSQNTTWWREVFPILYLPAYCSIRMTDIWRGFVAQRIAWTNRWHLLFHEPTVWQKRNEHDLMRDFRDEVPGYLNNRLLADDFAKLDLGNGIAHLGDNLRMCYEVLVRRQLVGTRELELLEAWLADLADLGIPGTKKNS